MVAKTLQPAVEVGGDCGVPGDKSISHRAVILGALSETPARVHNFLAAEDCLATVEAFRAMGIRIERQNNDLQIQGKGLEGLKLPRRPLTAATPGPPPVF